MRSPLLFNTKESGVLSDEQEPKIPLKCNPRYDNHISAPGEPYIPGKQRPAGNKEPILERGSEEKLTHFEGTPPGSLSREPKVTGGKAAAETVLQHVSKHA